MLLLVIAQGTEMVSSNTPIDQGQFSAAALEEAIGPDRSPISPPTEERQALRRLAHALRAAQGEAVKIVIGDEPAVDVPPSLMRVLRRGATMLAEDYAVTMGQVGKLLTIGQAADLLMVSRTNLVTLLDSGEVPSVIVDKERRVPLDRLLDYQAVLARLRRDALLQLTRSSEAMGLYDLANVEKLDRFPECDEEAES